MKRMLLAVNAKYIHSNLAVYSLKAYAEKHGYSVCMREFTINQREDEILRELYRDCLLYTSAGEVRCGDKGNGCRSGLFYYSGICGAEERGKEFFFCEEARGLSLIHICPGRDFFSIICQSSVQIQNYETMHIHCLFLPDFFNS